MSAPSSMPTSLTAVLIDKLGIHAATGAIVRGFTAALAGDIEFEAAPMSMPAEGALGAPRSNAVSCSVIRAWHSQMIDGRTKT